MDDYKKRFVEVDEIIKNLSLENQEKIPSKIINVIRNNKDSQYIWKYDKTKKLSVDRLHKDTIVILSYINTAFLLTDEQKNLMKKVYNYNELKNEEGKRKNINLNILFKKQ